MSILDIGNAEYVDRMLRGVGNRVSARVGKRVSNTGPAGLIASAKGKGKAKKPVHPKNRINEQRISNAEEYENLRRVQIFQRNMSMLDADDIVDPE
jgi:hypothetical protein